MGDLAFVRTRIESYADYTNNESRRLTDEQIRAYVGEALSRLTERLRPADTDAELLARVLLRCQFADQSIVLALDNATFGDPERATLHRADRELVALADDGEAVAPAGVAALVARIQAAFDARKRVITATDGTTSARYLH